MTENEIVAKFNALRSDLQRTAAQVVDLEAERDEHKLVLAAMAPMEKERKCFRLINGVLVEREVGGVVPELQANVDNVSLKHYSLIIDCEHNWEICRNVSQERDGAFKLC